MVLLAAVTWLLLQERLTAAIAAALGGRDAAARLIVGSVPVAVAGWVILRDGRLGALDRDEAVRRETLAAAELTRARHVRDTFIQSISHELRTPLTSIVGFAETLSDHGARLQPADVKLLSERLVANARRLERLVVGLLDVERLAGVRSVPTSPGRLGTIVRDTVHRADRGTHLVHVKVEDHDVELRLDRDRIERLVEELVSNAQRHTPAGGRILVRVRQVSDAVVLTIDDEGEGVDPLAVDRLFDPFHQHLTPATAHAPGLGIGLTLVDRYARLHGGSTWCEPGPLGGARFGVRFPLHGDWASPIEDVDAAARRAG